MFPTIILNPKREEKKTKQTKKKEISIHKNFSISFCFNKNDELNKLKMIPFIKNIICISNWIISKIIEIKYIYERVS